MKQLIAKAIVLTRIDYGEADRIITLLTPQYGKLRLIARGVRRVKSKLAGGIELFSVSDITFARGRGEIGTLVSSRLDKHYAYIATDLDRTMFGYETIKRLNKTTEDEPEPAYFELLDHTFAALNDGVVPLQAVQLWFSAQLLRLSGHEPNLRTDIGGQPLRADQAYSFDADHMAFAPSDHGRYVADHIKVLRLAFGNYKAKMLAQVQGGAGLCAELSPLVDTMLRSHLRI